MLAKKRRDVRPIRNPARRNCVESSGIAPPGARSKSLQNLSLRRGLMEACQRGGSLQSELPARQIRARPTGRALGALNWARPSSFHGNPPDLPGAAAVGAEVDEFASGVPGGAVVAAGVGGEAGGFVRVAEVEEVDVVVGVGVGVVVAAAVGDEGNAVAVLA